MSLEQSAAGRTEVGPVQASTLGPLQMSAPICGCPWPASGQACGMSAGDGVLRAIATRPPALRAARRRQEQGLVAIRVASSSSLTSVYTMTPCLGVELRVAPLVVGRMSRPTEPRARLLSEILERVADHVEHDLIRFRYRCDRRLALARRARSRVPPGSQLRRGVACTRRQPGRRCALRTARALATANHPDCDPSNGLALPGDASRRRADGPPARSDRGWRPPRPGGHLARISPPVREQHDRAMTDTAADG
jgi:hypothetical protein